jgi:hypothetical protein
MVRKSSSLKFEYRLYSLFSASNGLEHFWRWEILRPGSNKLIKAGVIYGTEKAAMIKVRRRMLRLSQKDPVAN